MAATIETIRAGLDEKRAKRYNLDLLRRIAWHVDRFAETCGACEGFKQDVANVLSDLETLVHQPSRANERSYRRSRTVITEHLKKVHKLVVPGSYATLGALIGGGVAAAIGVSTELQMFSWFGVILGLGIGWLLERWMKQRGRIL